MATLVAIPVLVALVILQTTIASRLPLLFGTADLVMVALVAWALQERVKNAWIWTVVGGFMVSYISALPMYVPLIGYLIITAIARVLQRRVWQTPVLVMFLTTLIGTIITQGLSILVLKANEIPIDLGEALRMVMLPSILLNLVLAIPIRAIMVDLAEWAYPVEIQT